jgi:hypothetical protein
MPQFGLIAEEVAEVKADLVVMNGFAGCPLDSSGLIFTLGGIGMRNLTTDHFRYEGKPALADKLANKSGLAVRSFRLFVEGVL